MARIVFVQNLYYAYFGVMCLSAVLKKAGHSVDIVVKDTSPDNSRLLQEIIALSPDAVGFSCMTGTIGWSLNVATALKKNIAIKTIFGGPHSTFSPEIIYNDGVDVVCRGEGEGAITEIMDAIDKGEELSQIQNCWIKKGVDIIKNDPRSLIDNLNAIPFPDRDLYRRYRLFNSSQGIFMAGRGCPFQCSFCFNHALLQLYKHKGSYVRLRSPGNVVAEIQCVAQEHKLKTVLMLDDTFTLNKQWVGEFSRLYEQNVKLPFICLIRADSCDEETVAHLARAGCRRAFMGIESGNEEMRENILKKKEVRLSVVFAVLSVSWYPIGRIRARTWSY